MELKLFFHPSCSASRRLIMNLLRRNLLSEIELIDVSNIASSGAMRYEVWSVPWLLYGSRAAAMDPIKDEEIVSIIERREADIPRHLETAFARAVLHSSYASALVYLHGSIEPVCSEALVSAAVRHPFGGPEPSEVILRLREAGQSFLEKLLDDVIPTLSMAYLRAFYWTQDLSDAEPPTDGELARWLLAQASIGRAGLPQKPSVSRERVGRLASYIRENFSPLLEKVAREQEELMNDEDYWEFLRSLEVQRAH